MMLPIPSCPDALAPQHATELDVSLRRAQLKPGPLPTDTALSPPGRVTAAYELGTALRPRSMLVLPLPSWPVPLSPQHLTAPPVSRAPPPASAADTAVAVVPSDTAG